MMDYILTINIKGVWLDYDCDFILFYFTYLQYGSGSGGSRRNGTPPSTSPCTCVSVASGCSSAGPSSGWTADSLRNSASHPCCFWASFSCLLLRASSSSLSSILDLTVTQLRLDCDSTGTQQRLDCGSTAAQPRLDHDSLRHDRDLMATRLGKQEN